MQPADAVARVEFAPYVLCAMLHVEFVVPLTILIGPAGNGPQRFHSVRLLNWRRKRDSNPRATYAANGFQDRRLQPLGHSSKLIVPDIVFRSRRFFFAGVRVSAREIQRASKHDFAAPQPATAGNVGGAKSALAARPNCSGVLPVFGSPPPPRPGPQTARQ